MRPIELSDDVLRLAEAQVAAGRAESIDAIVLAGVAALERNASVDSLRAAIDEGDASGTFDGDAFAAVRAKHRLTR